MGIANLRVLCPIKEAEQNLKTMSFALCVCIISFISFCLTKIPEMYFSPFFYPIQVFFLSSIAILSSVAFNLLNKLEPKVIFKSIRANLLILRARPSSLI